MRPLRLILLLICCVACPVLFTFVTLLHAHPRPQLSKSSITPDRKSGFSAFFSFNTPSALFPPSAIISLTDDNSTFFLARPAAFGPLLPSKGLSGQLWLGSGFGDDSLRRGGISTGAEGELGCSDVPGWGDDGHHKHDDDHQGGLSAIRKPVGHHADGAAKSTPDVGKSRRSVITTGDAISDLEQKIDPAPSEDDGTDDHLHHPLPGSEVSSPSKSDPRTQHEAYKIKGKAMAHADIQSLQEGAEIAGKVVLLSRGGCGFLEKVKWVQRRGGVALIVGDNTRGGGLVTMYARGDTSNVTIPSLFTSHTTAHLLSSLIPTESFSDDASQEAPAKLGQDGDRSAKGARPKKGNKKIKSNQYGGPSTRTTGKFTPTSKPRATIVAASTHVPKGMDADSPLGSDNGVSWLRSLFIAIGFGRQGVQSGMPDDSRRPPSSGQIDWVLSDDWSEDEMPTVFGDSGDGKETTKTSQSSVSQQAPGDDFVIGVQDWRDPDLVGMKSAGPSSKSSISKPKGIPHASARKSASSKGKALGDESTTKQAGKTRHENDEALEGGSITPGSGEYGKPGIQDLGRGKSSKPGRTDAFTGTGDSSRSGQTKKGFFSNLLWAASEGKSPDAVISRHWDHPSHSVDHDHKGASRLVEDLSQNDSDTEESKEHEGLWVTLTPTSMSASPFFDTLLVLVVSPLVTLTVVYALLLLRSRIRRRRWRAPKSVVDRLPVRTYHTMACSSSSSSSQPVSPNTSLPTTPLLRSTSQPDLPRSRPRSRTTSGVGAAVSASVDKSAVKASLLQQEKPEGSPQRKSRYTGKQVECVVCLEEYVDGQSKVMRLPCGHEFHVECM